jgi:D-arabinose 1-dehydrogenase-like Zn-dependent alcohol dehydrogenase
LRAVQLAAIGEPLRVVSVPEPVPGARDALVRISACGICRSDWHHWQGDWTWEGIQLQLPRILGHEASGVVEAVGSEVSAIKPGTRVCVPFHEACGRCVTCLSGATHLCDRSDYIGSTHDGAFAEYAVIPNADVNCVPLPAGVDAVDAAAMGCRYMTAYHAVVHRARAQAGEWAVVYGCGGLGLSLVQILTAFGVRAIAVDVDPARLEFAARLGAAETVDSKSVDPAERVREITADGAAASFDALGSSATFLSGIDSLRRGGRHVQIGLTSRDDAGSSSIPLDRITFREIEILGSLGNPVHAYRELLALVERDVLRPREIVTAEIALRDVPAAIERMSSYGLSGFVVVTSF